MERGTGTEAVSGHAQSGAVPSDEDLLRLCAKGDATGLEELTRRYQQQIFGFLYRLTGSYEDAEEATLEVFLRAWRTAGSFQYRARVATWLYRIALNIARDLHSRKLARPQEPWPEDEEVAASLAVGSAEDEAMESLAGDEMGKRLQAAMQKLSPQDRELLTLYYLQDYDYEEIQAITGLSYTVLKTRLARARQRLRRQLEKAQVVIEP
jgi:RNA polymerase sigma-70 factor (ECF subfamily)